MEQIHMLSCSNEVHKNDVRTFWKFRIVKSTIVCPSRAQVAKSSRRVFANSTYISRYAVVGSLTTAEGRAITSKPQLSKSQSV